MGKTRTKPGRSKIRAISQSTVSRLGTDIAEAHRRWPRLSVSDRARVTNAIAQRYGWSFAKKFSSYAKSLRHKPPSAITAESRYTRQQLRDRGYRRFQTVSPGYEKWVRPDGHEIHAFVERRPSKKEKPSQAAPVGPSRRAEEPDRIEVETEEEAIATYGDIVASRRMKMWGKDMFVTLYDDGTIEVQDPMTGELTTMIEKPNAFHAGGKKTYRLYDDDGNPYGVDWFDPAVILADH